MANGQTGRGQNHYTAVSLQDDSNDDNDYSGVMTTIPLTSSVIDRTPDERKIFFEELKASILSNDYGACEELLQKGFDINALFRNFYFHPLLQAAKKGNERILTLLLDNGSDINVVDNKKWNALHITLQQNYKECSQILINRNIDINKPNCIGNLPLHDAVDMNMLEIVQLLLDKRCDPNARGLKNKTPLHIAAEKGHLEVLKLLLRRESSWDSTDKENNRPLHLAALKNNSECCKALMIASHERVKEHVNSLNKYKQTPLIMAAKKGHATCCKYIMDFGADVNLLDDRNNSALHHACQQGGRLVTIKQLLTSKRVDFGQNVQGNTPMHLLIKGVVSIRNHEQDCKSIECLTLLINYFEDASVLNKEDQSVFHLAAKKDCITGLNILLERFTNNGNLLQRDKEGNTPLLIALKHKNYEMAETLIYKSSQSVSVVDNDGNTPLHIIFKEGILSLTKLLLGKTNCKNLNLSNNDGMTALHLAAKAGLVDSCKWLLDNSCILKIDSKGYTSFHYAAEEGHLELLKLMEKRKKSSYLELTDTGDSSLHLAARNGHVGCCKFLLKKMNTNTICQSNNDDNTALDEAFQLHMDEIFQLILMKIPFVKYEDIQNQKKAALQSSSLHAHFHSAIADDRKTIQEAIIESDWWNVALSSSFCWERKEKEPCCNLRELTIKNPKLVEVIYSKCINKENKCDFRIFEDSHYIPTTEGHLRSMSPFDSTTGDFLKENAVKYENIPTHPLMLAAENKQIRLMEHPLTQSYLSYRWHALLSSYLLMVLINEIFALTVIGYYVWSVRNWDMITHDFNKNEPNEIFLTSHSNFSHDVNNKTSVEITQKLFCSGEIKTYFIDIYWPARVFVFILMICVIFLMSFLQILYFRNLKMNQLSSFDTYMRCGKIIGFVILVCPFTGCYPYTIAILSGWQWQIGIITLMVSCLHVLNIFNKFSSCNVVMSITLKHMITFVRVLIYISLIIISFAFSFHLLLPQNAAFGNRWFAFVKTITWLLGDLGYDDTFLSDQEYVPFPALTNLMFLLLITSVAGFFVQLILLHPMNAFDQMREEIDLNALARRIRLTITWDTLLQTMKAKTLNQFGLRKEQSRFVRLILLFFSEPSADFEAPSNKEKEVDLAIILKAIDGLTKEMQGLTKEMQEMKEKIEDINKEKSLYSNPTSNVQHRTFSTQTSKI